MRVLISSQRRDRKKTGVGYEQALSGWSCRRRTNQKQISLYATPQGELEMFEVKKSCLLKRRIRTVFFNILIKHAKKIQHFKIKTQLGSGTSAHLGPFEPPDIYMCIYTHIKH